MKTPDVIAGRQIRLALTRNEAAAALGVSPITIDRLTQRKLLTPCRATRRPLYALSELERFLRDTRSAGPAVPQDFPAADVCASNNAGVVPEQTKGKNEVNRGASAPIPQTGIAGGVPISARTSPGNISKL